MLPVFYEYWFPGRHIPDQPLRTYHSHWISIRARQPLILDREVSNDWLYILSIQNYLQFKAELWLKKNIYIFFFTVGLPCTSRAKCPFFLRGGMNGSFTYLLPCFPGIGRSPVLSNTPGWEWALGVLI